MSMNREFVGFWKAVLLETKFRGRIYLYRTSNKMLPEKSENCFTIERVQSSQKNQGIL